MNCIKVNGFMLACCLGHKDIVEKILEVAEEFNFDLNAKDCNGNTGFANAHDGGHVDIVEMITEVAEKLNIDLELPE